MIKKLGLIKLTRDLIRIDSQNPPGDETRIARFAKDYLEAAGIRTKIYEFKKNRPNLIAVMNPGRNKKSLLITPHLDTVPKGLGWRFDPFAGRIAGGKIFGLGATDCKGNLACAMEVLRSLSEEKAHFDYALIFAATADEETGSDFGLAPLLEKKMLSSAAAVVLDSDDFSIIVAQKGLIHVKVSVFGKRAHGAYPWLGVNAIDAAVNIIREIKTRRPAYKRNRYLRGPTVNVGTIRGGDKVNIVADWCEFELDFRFLPGMSAKNILADLKRTVKKYARGFRVEVNGVQDFFLINENYSLIDSLKKAFYAAGVRPRVMGSEGATTISFFQKAKIPAVATGFGCAGCAHTANEYIRIDSLYKGAIALETFLKNFKFR